MALPQRADYSPTESALIPFQAEPTQFRYGRISYQGGFISFASGQMSRLLTRHAIDFGQRVSE